MGWWTDGDGNGNGKKMKSLDVGLAGTWAITVDQTVRLSYLPFLMYIHCRWSSGMEPGTGLVVPEPGAAKNIITPSSFLTSSKISGGVALWGR